MCCIMLQSAVVCVLCGAGLCAAAFSVAGTFNWEHFQLRWDGGVPGMAGEGFAALCMLPVLSPMVGYQDSSTHLPTSACL